MKSYAQYLSTMVLIFFVPVASAKLYISGFLANPEGSDTGHEIVKLTNASDDPVALDLYELDADKLPYYQLPQAILQPFQQFMIGLRTDDVSGVDVVTGINFGSSNMRNTSGEVGLYQLTGSGRLMVDQVVYGEQQEGVWFQRSCTDIICENMIETEATTESQTLTGVVLIEDSSTGSVLQEDINHQSPKSEVLCSPMGDLEMIVISELYPNPVGADNGLEWVELYNLGSETVRTCERLQIDDVEGQSSPKTAYIELLAGEYMVLNLADYTITLNNSADEFRLINASTGEVIDRLAYENAPEAKSYSRVIQ